MCQFEQYLSHRQNERRAHPSWAPTKEPTMSCWRYTPSPKQDRFQDFLEAICPDFQHTTTAIQTISVTTQHGTKSEMHPLRRHCWTDLLQYRRLNMLMYSDTMYFKVKLLNQNKCGQIYATDDYATSVS